MRGAADIVAGCKAGGVIGCLHGLVLPQPFIDLLYLLLACSLISEAMQSIIVLMQKKVKQYHRLRRSGRPLWKRRCINHLLPYIHVPLNFNVL